MVGILSAGTANIKAYFYGAVIAIFFAMVGTIWYLNGRVDTLTKELNTAKGQVETAKNLIASMTGAAKIDDEVNTFIDTGISIMISDHEKIEDQLRKDYEAYLMESRKDEMCKDYCKGKTDGDQFCPVPTNGGITSPPKPPVPNKEDVIKKKMLEAMWKNYCLNNRTAEGCKQ